MMKLLALLALSLCVNADENKYLETNSIHGPARNKRNAVFPDGSSQGIFLALAIPIDLPGGSITLSYNYEANYNLPSNASQFTDPFGAQTLSARRAKRSLDRSHVYLSLENRLASQGLNGRACILRTICETAEFSLQHNGLVGDLMHILFTPSTSRNKKLHRSFSQAERRGVKGYGCGLAYPDCPVGLYDFVTTLDL